MVRPIRVVHVVTRMNVGGPARHLHALLPRLHERGFVPVLVHGRPEAGEGELPIADVDIQVIRNPWLRRPIDPVADLRASNELRRTLARLRPEIVHTHLAKAGALGRTVGRLVGAHAVVHTFHGHVLEGYFGTPANRLFLEVERRLARGTDALVAVSEAVRDDLLALGVGQRERWHVVALGLDVEPFREPFDRSAARRELDIEGDGPVIGIVGRLVPIKNHVLFLEAAKAIAAARPDARFLVAGDGELRPMLEAEAAEHLGDRVRFMGWVPALPALYAALDVVVLTSLNEGTPVALMEAAAAGRPVVATDVGGVREVVALETGMVVPPTDAARLATAVVQLLEDRRLATEMGRRARARALETFSADAMADAVAALYRRLLAR